MLAPAELAAVRYMDYSYWIELSGGRLRYVARARNLSTHPYLILTATLDELTAELSAEQA